MPHSTTMTIGITGIAMSFFACVAPPIRGTIARAPGGRSAGELELSGAAALGLLDYENPVALGGLEGAYAFTDHMALEAGANGGGGEGWRYTGGWTGVRAMLPMAESTLRGFVWDVEVGVGGGAIFNPDTYFVGGYGGVGVAHRWHRVAVFGRLRSQAASGGDVATCVWNTLALGAEFQLKEWLDIFFGLSESVYFAEEDTVDTAPTAQVGVALQH